MRIGIDIDDTISNTWESFIPDYEKLFDIPAHKLEKSIPYYPSVKEKYTKEEYFKLAIPVYQKCAPNAKLKDNVKEVIDKLYDLGHKVIFITDRSIEYDDAYKVTKDYLDRHEIKYDKIIVKSGNKAKVCLDEKIDLFIDNSIKHCTSVAKTGVEVLMFETEYNKDLKEFKHVKDWNEIYEYLRSRWHNEKWSNIDKWIIRWG